MVWIVCRTLLVVARIKALSHTSQDHRQPANTQGSPGLPAKMVVKPL